MKVIETARSLIKADMQNIDAKIGGVMRAIIALDALPAEPQEATELGGAELDARIEAKVVELLGPMLFWLRIWAKADHQGFLAEEIDALLAKRKDGES